jgi:hypothetical protein
MLAKFEGSLYYQGVGELIMNSSNFRDDYSLNRKHTFSYSG